MSKDITLPIELAKCQLTTEEIGTIFVLYSMPNLGQESKKFWSDDNLFVETINELHRRNILKASHDENGDTIMEIDISKLEIPEPKFWTISDYNLDGNTVYSHPSHCGDEDSSYEYRMIPRLENDKIVYSLEHSEFGDIESFVYSLDEGEEIVKLELEQELLNIKKEHLKNSKNG